MRKLLFPLAFLFFVTFAAFYCTKEPAHASGDNMLKILCYHDVAENEDIYTVSPTLLEQHINYLLQEGYTFIDAQTYVDINKGLVQAPPKSVMLTFDDGYLSFYTQVYPLLKKHNIPALFSIVGSWMNGNKPSEVGELVTWEQLREMQASGLVTIASHSYALHHWAEINSSQDKSIPAQSRLFINSRYETAEAFASRIRFDLFRAQQQMEKNLGQPAKFLVWPYGGYNEAASMIAEEMAFTATFGLAYAGNKISTANAHLGQRGLIIYKPDTEELEELLDNADSATKPYRMAQIDIDSIYNKNSKKITQDNINALIGRLKKSGVRTVALQTFVDIEGSGDIKQVYFHSDSAPVKVDIFSHIVSQLAQEGIQTYAWVTLLANPWMSDNQDDYVQATDEKKLGWYKRLTPFSQANKEKFKKMTAEIAIYAPIAGILFQDDMYLNDFEDFSPAAKAAYREKFGRELTPQVRDDPQTMKEWSEWKTDTLIDLTNEIAAEVRKYRPDIKVLRNIYPTLIMEPESEEWFAQNYVKFLNNYDYTVVMAYPYLEKKYKNPHGWLKELTEEAMSAHLDAPEKVIMKIQTYDWNKNRWLKVNERFSHIRAMQEEDAQYFAYYPEILMLDKHWPE